MDAADDGGAEGRGGVGVVFPCKEPGHGVELGPRLGDPQRRVVHGFKLAADKGVVEEVPPVEQNVGAAHNGKSVVPVAKPAVVEVFGNETVADGFPRLEKGRQVPKNLFAGHIFQPGHVEVVEIVGRGRVVAALVDGVEQLGVGDVIHLHANLILLLKLPGRRLQGRRGGQVGGENPQRPAGRLGLIQRRSGRQNHRLVHNIVVEQHKLLFKKLGRFQILLQQLNAADAHGVGGPGGVNHRGQVVAAVPAVGAQGDDAGLLRHRYTGQLQRLDDAQSQLLRRGQNGLGRVAEQMEHGGAEGRFLAHLRFQHPMGVHGKAPFLHGVGEAANTLHLRKQLVMAAHEGNAPVSGVQQPPRQVETRLIVVEGQQVGVDAVRGPVQKHHGNIADDDGVAEIRHIFRLARNYNKSGHLLADVAVDDLPLQLGGVVGEGDLQGVVGLLGGGDDALENLRTAQVLDIGEHHAEFPCTVAPQRPGRVVGYIVEGLHGLHDAVPGGLLDVLCAVDAIGHRGHGDPRHAGDILHGRHGPHLTFCNVGFLHCGTGRGPLSTEYPT